MSVLSQIEIKPCPFCGGKAIISEVHEHPYEANVQVVCLGCNMTFSHTQEFVRSLAARVAVSKSFLEVWDRRVCDGNKEDL